MTFYFLTAGGMWVGAYSSGGGAHAGLVYFTPDWRILLLLGSLELPRGLPQGPLGRRGEGMGWEPRL